MGDKSQKIIGWCHLHFFTITREKFDQKCRSARQGKQCKQFTRQVPRWSRSLKRGGTNGHSK